MGVVELDRDLLRKLVPVLVGAPEALDEIAQRTGHKEIFLHETQALTHAGRVVGIEHPSERFRGERLRDRANKIAMTENFEVEVIRRRGLPKSEGVDGLASETNDGPVERDADQLGGPPKDGSQASAARFERAVQMNFDLLVWPGDLPRIRPAQPIVRSFLLPTILDGLFEHPIFV